MKAYEELLLRGDSLTPIGLYDLFQATAEQLCRLQNYSPGSLNMVKNRLKQLENAGYVESMSYAVPHEGERLRHHHVDRWYYTLGPKAKHYFEDLGYDMPEGWRTHRPRDEKGIFIEHELGRNDIVIAAALIRYSDPNIRLHRFQHARIFAHEPIRVTANGISQRLIPDGLLDFRQQLTGLHLAALLEHDKDTEPEPKFKQKIRKYVALMSSDYGQVLLYDYVTIAFTTFAGIDRLTKMRHWTEEVLRESYASSEVGHHFRFVSLPRPITPGVAWLEPRWLSPYAGDEPEPLLVA